MCLGKRKKFVFQYGIDYKLGIFPGNETNFYFQMGKDEKMENCQLFNKK